MKDYEDKRIQEIIEENESTRKVRRELSGGLNLISELGNRKSRLGIIEEATKFYKELYKKDTSAKQKIKYGTNNNESVPEILEEEIEHIFKGIKKGKALGPDSIDNENLLALNHSMIPALTVFFNKILETEVTPEQWNTAEIRILHKKGDKNENSKLPTPQLNI